MSGTPVFYARSADYERKNLRTALEQLVEGQLRETGGVAGKKLLLKPNLLAWRHSNDIACVHPAVIVETARIFLEAGASEVSILENPAVQTTPAILRAMGIEQELEDLHVRTANFTDYRRIARPEGVKFHNLELAAECLEYDAVIDLAKAKTHAMMILTLCVKNLFGLVKGSERMGWHLAVGKDFDPNLHEAVSQEASDTVPAGKVIRQWSFGYKTPQRLLKPAMVVVSSGPQQKADE